MLSLALFLTLQTQQDDQVVLGTVDIGGKQVVMSVPSEKGPFDDSMAMVEVGGYKYLVDSEGNLRTRFRGDGGWGHIAATYPKIAPSVATAPEYRIKVIVFSRSEELYLGDSLGRNRYVGFFKREDLDEIYLELARFKAIAETAAHGKVRLTFDVSIEEETLFRSWLDDGRQYPTVDAFGRLSEEGVAFNKDSSWIQQFAHNEIAPLVNDSTFEGGSTTYQGPYSSIYVLHPMTMPDLPTNPLLAVPGQTPISIVSVPKINQLHDPVSLAGSFFEVWKTHLVASAQQSGRFVGATGQQGTANLVTPTGIDEFPLTNALVKSGNRMFKDSDTSDETIVVGPMLPTDHVFVLSSDRRITDHFGRVLCDPLLSEAFMKAHPDAKPVSRLGNIWLSWDWIEYELPGFSAKNDLEALGLERPSGTPFQERLTTSYRAQTIATGTTIRHEDQWMYALKGPLSSEDIARFRTILAGNNLEEKLAALDALSKFDTTELTTDIGYAAMSGEPSESYLALHILKNRKDDAAWSQIASVAVRGPFGANYRFAAQALRERPEDVTVDLLSAAMFDRNWRTRQAAALTLNQIESPKANLLAPIILDDPDPRVRITAALGERAKRQPFASRLAWSAANDESEAVRMACSMAMISSDDPEVRSYAFSAVRDEGETVRLAILRAMTMTPREEYRQSLRAAVVDRSPAVRAAALRALAAQPGAVIAEEVQNTINDPHPLVRTALLELSKAKGIALP